MPALLLLVDNASAPPAGSRRRRGLLGFAVVAYVLPVQPAGLVWSGTSPALLGFVGSNAYVWISIALLLALPIRCQREPRWTSARG